MILSKKGITKALIRLRRCAGWSAPVLFTSPRRQVFSRWGPYVKLYDSSQENLTSEFPTRSCPNQPAQLQRRARKLFGNKQIAKALIRLCGCPGWSAPFLFTCNKVRFSCVEAHIIKGSLIV